MTIKSVCIYLKKKADILLLLWSVFNSEILTLVSTSSWIVPLTLISGKKRERGEAGTLTFFFFNIHIFEVEHPVFLSLKCTHAVFFGFTHLPPPSAPPPAWGLLLHLIPLVSHLSFPISSLMKANNNNKNKICKKSVTLLDLIPILTLTSKPSLGPRAQPERSEAWSGRPDVTNMSSLWRSKTRSGSQRDRSTGTLTHTPQSHKNRLWVTQPLCKVHLW